MAPIKNNDSIIVIGAGVFGLSTALELSKRGYRNITVLDRHVPPVVDGSSVDISRIIRIDYADPLYAQMAREAYQGWINEYTDFYYESGFVMLADTFSNPYMSKAKEIVKSQGGRLDEFNDANQIRSLYANVQADLDGLFAVHNPIGGWADAERSIQHLARQCNMAGVSFITGPRGTVHSLRKSGTRVVGVNLTGGGYLLASQVILSTGAWSNRLVDLSHAASASGQPVGFIKLTPEESRELENTPVMINMSTGVFCFPPTPGTNILKLARHGYGFATETTSEATGRLISSPKRDGSNAESGYLPNDADEGLREGLRQFFPKLKGRDWMNRRLCWYTDTPGGDFIIDHHPILDGLFVATGGAGHAFKFLPVLGRYVADCFENTASQSIRRKWQLQVPVEGAQASSTMMGDGSRGGPPLRKLNAIEQSKL
ncbi:putative fructosyl amino acid oxidase [Talaromyces proteolyticus]|uniref:Fructosyl amino acid oxidase n=1 Tax=Talaromyces proteolyticus TaxID=1131652 RepID=A0AAD4Q457_9EURO|nr:putative fructosyl amino acid oxidase [Talaromyces proteolyticus]KAH8702352.1 putative fructosyl amino acid oxidase [Talaromyces proteolyticus]